jgi:hypothetical protein
VVGRRLVILVAVLMGLMVLAAGLAPPPPTPRERGGAARTPAPAASAAPGPAATASPGSSASTSPVYTLDVARGRDHVTVTQGALFTLNVVANTAGSVEVVGLDYVGAVDPSTPARMQIDAVRPGHFPVKLVEGGRPLGELVVTPAS